MTLYDMLDRTKYYREVWIFEQNAFDQNMPVFKGIVNDARADTDVVWDYLLCEVEQYDCMNGVIVIFIKDEHFNERLEKHYIFGDQWGEDRKDRPWLYSAEIEMDLSELKKERDGK